MAEAEPFIRFYCENCGYKSTVSESYAGKNIRCPNCYYIIFISKAESKGTTSQSSPGKPETPSKHSAYDLTLLDVEEKDKIATFQRGQTSIFEETDVHKQELEEESQAEAKPFDERRLPWLIDIFLYPFNKPGLIHLAIFIAVPPLIDFMESVVPGVLSILFYIISAIVKILIFLYIYWYLAECVRDSAAGWVRAPQGFGGIPTLSDMFGQVVNIIGCLAVFLGPFAIYTIYAGETNIISWLLLSVGVFLYPMALLALLIFDSARDFKPLLLFNSIYNTFFPYFGLFLLFVITVILIRHIPEQVHTSPFLKLIIRSVIIYIALIGAHILGRFYWRYKEKLKWEV